MRQASAVETTQPGQRRGLRAARPRHARRGHLRLLRRRIRRRAHVALQPRGVRPVAAPAADARGRGRHHDGDECPRPEGLDADPRLARGASAYGPSRRELAVARAAAAGTIMCVPTFAMATPQIAAGLPTRPRWFQLYWHPDEVTKSILDQAREAGALRSSSPSDLPKLGRRSDLGRLHARSGLPDGRLRLRVRRPRRAHAGHAAELVDRG
jgi:hypothetical protein